MPRSHIWLGSRRNSPLVVACASLLVMGSAMAQSSVTTSSLAIGGPGALGCATPLLDPPTLEDGVLASADCDYSYDSFSQILTLTVTNTSLIVPGEPNPLISKIYVNLPQLAIASATLISQAGSGGATPNFTLAVDTNVTDTLGSLVSGCFGKFGLRLQHAPGLNGSIKNAGADLIAGTPSAMVVGPVVFQIQIVGSSAASESLIAQAFSHSWSVNDTTSTTTNAAFLFAGGINDTGGILGSGPAAGGGSAAGWVTGTPQAGQTITVVQSGTPTWSGVFVASTSPGPIVVGSHTYGIGPDFFVVLNGTIPPVGFLSSTFVVPPAPAGPEIGTVTFFAIVVLASPDQRIISVSETTMLEVEF